MQNIPKPTKLNLMSREFKEMMKEIRQGQVLEMGRLTSTIPKDPKESWKKLDERHGNRKLRIIAAMSDLTQLELPAGLANKRIKALVQGVRLAKARLRPVGRLVEKLKQESRTRWCHYQAKRPDGAQHDGLEVLLEVEWRAAAIQLQSTLAARYQ